MAANICGGLLNKSWRSYNEAMAMLRGKEVEGLYLIGKARHWGGLDVDVLYLGRSEDIYKRLRQHLQKSREKIQDINKYLQSIDKSK